MGSPQRNIGRSLESPYAKHLSQYPSQSEGFMPNEFGGKNWGPSTTPSKQQHQGNNYQHNTSNRRRGNNRYYNVNRGAGSGGNSNPGGGGGGYRNNYQNNFQSHYNQQHTAQRHSNNGNRQQPYHGQKYNKSDGNSRNDYYHPSMLVDPWKDLLDRHNAIRDSQIDVTSKTPAEDERESSQDEDSSDPAISSKSPTTTTTTTTMDDSKSISP